MAAKKKKTQIKKVERGYATTSIPKKAPVATAPAEEAAEVPDTREGNVEKSDATPSVSAQDENVAVLQRLVDKFQEKTEREIARTLKSIDYDKRMAKTFPLLDVDQTIVDEVIKLIAAEYSQGDKLKLPDMPRDKLTSQIGITYGVMRRLGFSEELVLKCLREASGVELEQALDWIYAHCSTDELDFQRRLDGPSENTLLTPQTPDTSTSPGTPQEQTKVAPPPSPSLNSGSNGTELFNALKPGERVDDFRSEDGSDIDDPNVEYARLKLRITDLTGSRRRSEETTSNEFLRKLQARLESVKKDYFFSEKEAEAMFREKRREADEAKLLARLRGETVPSPAPPRPAKKDVETEATPKEVSPTDDIFDNSGDEYSLGGMFELLEPMPTTETTATGTTVVVRDMALPKHWAGRTPKSLLLDFITKSDRHAAVTYTDLSGSSRAKRSSVHVQWTGGRTSQWAMEDVACYDLVQAEHYIATVALHSLTYPGSDSFRISVGDPKGAQTSYRHLPPTFRELWNELEVKRKEDEDRSNRNDWESLTAILDQRWFAPKKREDKGVKAPPPKENLYSKERTAPRLSEEQLKAEFRARQSSRPYQEMLKQRNALPIASYRKTVIEMLEMSPVIVLSGETGCGKSTQLPSFILEDHLSSGQHCKIVVTEPRRISAISLAQRVSRELGDPPGSVGTNTSLVGYTIRLESQTSKNTRLNFVTNGIALRMLEGGSGSDGKSTAFDDVTHIVVDEVHERSIDSDFLLIVLKSLLQERRDLKVILMSATLDAEKISNYFGGCPTIQVPGRTFPVDVRFLEDALEYTQWSISDTSPYAKRINDKFNRNKTEWSEDIADNTEDADDQDAIPGTVTLKGPGYSKSTVSTMNLLDERQIPYDLIVCILERVCSDPTLLDMSPAFLVFMPGLGEIRRLNDILSEHPLFGSDKFQVFPLHSTISSEDQSLVFDIPPPGIRKIVIATNIAETGVTIPDITCVIDSGKHREMRFDEKRQISRLIETFIARSNAAQRRGRAGRVRSGLCFHLFSKARHESMAEHPLPEMLRLSLSDLALRIKILKVNLGSSIEDVLSNCLDPPSSINIQRAKNVLIEVGALTTTEDITSMGRLLSKLPTDVHLGKFMLIAASFRCLDPALTIAATLNSKSPFITPFGLEQEADRAKKKFKTGDSDFLTLHNAFASWRKASANPGFIRKFCRQNFLSQQNLQQVEELRQQFMGYLVDVSFIKVGKEFIRELSRSRYTRGNRTHFVPVPTEYDRNSDENMALLNAALAAGLYPKLLTLYNSGGRQQLHTLSNNQPVAFHPSSVNFRTRPQDFGVNYLSYFTIMQSKRMYVWETGPVDDLAIVLLCGDCEFKLIVDSVIIDRKIRYRLTPKGSVALKCLRANLANNLATQFRGKELTERQMKWNELAIRLLAKTESNSARTDANNSITIQ